jgi:hypothetical protein
MWREARDAGGWGGPPPRASTNLPTRLAERPSTLRIKAPHSIHFCIAYIVK